MASVINSSNPLLKDWSSLNHGLPPFGEILPSHFEEALNYSMEQTLQEIGKIVSNLATPTFENTILALDRSGSLFNQVTNTFSNLCSSNGVPELQAVELKMAGPLAAHGNKVATFPGLFTKIDAVYASRLIVEPALTSQQIRLIERYHLDFVRAGAKFDADAQAKYARIIEELAGLETKFTQNVMADEAEIYLELKTETKDFQGLPEDLILSAKQAAKERNIPGEDPAIITLSRSLVEPFLTFSERRDLREQAWKLWTNRGELANDRMNLPIAKRILELRIQQAHMHGYDNYGEYQLADTMARHPLKVTQLLEEVWQKAKISVGKEREALEAYKTAKEGSKSSDQTAGIEAWDWRYYAEKVRQANYDLDNQLIKPYFPLTNMVTAIFDVSYSLFHLVFIPREDIVAYHPDVKVYEVYEETVDTTTNKKTRALKAIFLHDNYARPHKRSGAWMSEFRSQMGSGDDRVIPIVVNNNNFNKPSSAEDVTLLSFDDAVTLFHEFGHGLHGMLSNVPYQRLASTNVLRDFVELPSQLYEHWLSEEVVLKKHARHVKTNEVIPDELLTKLMNARHFNLGFMTMEYTASALVDAAVHALPEKEILEVNLHDFEQATLMKLGMPQALVPRHRLPHFQHLFSGSSYAAAYYVYLWAEVLDADAFDAFKETGDCFHPEVAERVKKFIYSAGNSQDPTALFRAFRGRDPIIEPMLKKKGLLRYTTSDAN